MKKYLLAMAAAWLGMSCAHAEAGVTETWNATTDVTNNTVTLTTIMAEFLNDTSKGSTVGAGTWEFKKDYAAADQNACEIRFTTTAAGTLEITLAAEVVSGKGIYMYVNGDTDQTLSCTYEGEAIPSGTLSSAIAKGGVVSYEIIGGNTYNFYCSGTKYRVGGFSFTPSEDSPNIGDVVEMGDPIPAFPGAEGFARYTTTGGRGGSVVHVTNLNDSGTGSLRWALQQGGNGSKPITVVFDVSGYIDLESDLQVYGNTTIAGQTAPEGGITIRYYTVNYTKGNNIITRFIRFRRSQIKDVNDGADASWGRHYNNIIFDHCSFSWAIDEIASFYDNKNFTMQWCMLGEALANSGHDKGEHSYGGIWGGKGASFHHTFLCHAQNRTPRFNGARYGWEGYDANQYPNTVEAERVDFRNCVIYNWGTGGCYGGPGGGYINMVNNYYKAGPGTKNKNRITLCSINSASVGSTDHPELYGYYSRYYVNGNYVTNVGKENYDWTGVEYDSGYVTKNGLKCMRFTTSSEIYYTNDGTFTEAADGYTYIPIKLDAAIECGDVTTHDAQTAYDKVLAYAGASLYRDDVDARYVEEARTGTVTYTGEVSGVAGIIDLVNPVGESVSTRASYPELTSNTRDADYDTDGDGMPDAWEIANGLDPNDASDSNLYTLCEKGWYTNIEVYINSIVQDIVVNGNADAIDAIDEYHPIVVNVVNGIGSPVMTSEIKMVEYFNLNGVRISTPAPGVTIRRITYASGLTLTDKVVK